MWYNDLLLILMGFIAIVMILMAVIMGSRVKKPPKAQEEQKTSQPEKILVERGFENHKEEQVEPEPEPEADYSDYMPPETTEYTEPSIEETVEIEPTPIIEDEPITEPEIIQEPPEPDYSAYMPPEKPQYEAPSIEEPAKPEQILEETETAQEEPEYLETEPQTPDESVEITPIEPIIIDVPEDEPEREIPDIYGSPSIEEPDMDVVITPNQTFYDPVIEKPSIEPEPEILEPELETEVIPEIELPAIETEPTEQVPEEIASEEEPELIETPVETLEERSRKRIRKPIIDESDPDINIDLGVETCPHCGSKVPNTIYCINCGKALDPENTILDEEGEEN